MKIDDIAKLANVSKSAVSIALSGKPGVSQATREKILKIVQETGYIPRTMVNANQVYKMNHIIRFVAVVDTGFMVEQYNKQPFFMELIQHLENKCRDRGYSLLFSKIDLSNFDHGLSLLKDDNSENSGIILLGTNLNKEQMDKIAAVQPNIVVIDNLIEELHMDFVVMNNLKGVYEACEHLVSKGHKRIGYVKSKYRIHNFESRRQGFLLAKEKLNFDSPSYLEFELSPEILTKQDMLLDQLNELKKEGHELPTALFCENDYLAISVIKTLMSEGIRVPEHISVVGFDNITESLIISPELTTVHVEKETMAQLALDKLIQKINNPKDVALKMIVDTKLIQRKSVKKLKN